MLIERTNNIRLNPGLFVGMLLLVLFSSLWFFATPVSAASTTAEKACEGLDGPKRRAACAYGYDHGTRDNYEALCKDKYKDSELLFGSCMGGASLRLSKAATDPTKDAKGNTDPAIKCSEDECDFVGKYINPGINLLSAAFGLIAVISIIMGGIQYTASGGDPQKVTQAKQRIAKTIVAVLVYFIFYAFLQFLVPGGLFKR
jgi:hypothetical protein